MKRGMVWVIMGGQFGSEGKGNFVTYFSSKLHSEGKLGGVVRTGGPNAGHTMTFYHNDDEKDPNSGMVQYKMRQIPCGWHCDGVPLFIGPGSLINKRVLDDENFMVGKATGNLVPIYIDGRAIMVERDDPATEYDLDLRAKIGSTMEGIGAARVRHVNREAMLADEGIGASCDVAQELETILQSGKDIIIESTQGFSLSLTHSGYYPFVTSRDVTPGIILNDAGLSSRVEHRVISVIRTYPIRVAGNSGPTGGDELKWEELGFEPEHTTVTKLERRIFSFSRDDIKRMALLCRPDFICLTFLDYLAPDLRGCTDTDELYLNHRIQDFIIGLNFDVNPAVIRWVATGPGIITEVPLAAPPRLVWGASVQLGQ